MKNLQILSSIPGRLRIKDLHINYNHHMAFSLEEGLKKLQGIIDVKVSHHTNNILVQYNAGLVDVKKISQYVMDLDLTKISIQPTSTSVELSMPIPQELPIKYQKRQVIVSGIVLAYTFVKTILFGVPLLSLGPINIAAVATIATGYPLFRHGINGLVKEKKFNNDFLITTATIMSLWMRESLTGLAVIWLISVSELFEAMTVDRSRKAIRDMLNSTEEKAWILLDGKEVSIATKDLNVDDIVVIHSGEKIPVDGIIISGEALVNQAPITGESVPIFKEADSLVFAGTILEQGRVYVCAKKVGDDTTISRIIHLVEEASNTRAPIQNVADQYSEKLVPWSFFLSGLVYLFTGNLIRAMTILIVACPCAAGLATPTALAAAMGNAAKRGVLIKGGKYLEGMAKIDTVLFDKTGTLTRGKPSVTSVYPVADWLDTQETMYIAASCEQGNRHPLALAVVNKALEMDIEPNTPDHIDVVIGKGIIAGMDNQNILLGNRKLMMDHDIDISLGHKLEILMQENGETILYLSQNNQLIALIGVKDTIKEESLQTVKELEKRGIHDVGMITGDTTTSALGIANQLNIKKIISDVLPEGKAAIVKLEKEKGRKILMVGDGINDSPALALADVGVAMGTGGTDIAIESADIVLAGDNPLKIIEAIDISKKTLSTIQQSYGIAIGINALGILLGATSIISPFWAAILHNASTVGVVINSSRLLKYQPTYFYREQK
ncbi:heavy metal translocating P-type ATPase [Alkaliphilus hydrothermalis]|uniref:Cd(2+)-exporting ATPase n=1 Tax=Alkaliphilus hydrothermalis TaxID=1482730 RepID=A0ABS2NNG7_9FIRM|nr:cation-translocating P-type ATPase [Alkaliphilus hydrothermalis]MBM7614488.1 heavy metal translocating P-type ATPase [Alkaliphilus hydrothermalis]